MLPKELRSRRILLGVTLEALATRVAIEPLLLAYMESGDESITPAVKVALETLERERAEARTSENEQP